MNQPLGWAGSPAHQAVEDQDAETLARLLASGADPDEAYDNLTLLTHAVDVEGDSALQSGEPLTVHTTAILLAFGADPELCDPGGQAPLDVARHYDHQPAIELLRAHIGRRAGDGGQVPPQPTPRP
ncbi:ankyrin repeat domain-containing protein [Streptomyces sp. NPDC005004]